MSNRSGRAFTSGNGATTAPGESGTYCGSFGCHFSGSFDPEGQIKLLTTDSLEVDKYIPGEGYIIKINIEHNGTPAGYGFQLVGLKSDDNSGISGFTNLPNKVQQVSLGDRQYIEHEDILQTNPIYLNWTAPESGIGNIDFYGAVNVVNGNSESTGDGADTTQLKITEDIMSSLSEYKLNSATILVYPNPASDLINIESNQSINSVSIINLEGRMVKSISSPNLKIMDVSNLHAGVYVIHIITGVGTIEVKRIFIN